MDKYITGITIKRLRQNANLTQTELAEILKVSDKTISKWETGKGYPDITLLETIAEAFHISVTELLTGETIQNTNISSNMLRSKFYVCPVCGNILHSMGNAQISCHGISLPPLEAEPENEQHSIEIEEVEDEYFVLSTHEMNKDHYISFMAAVTPDRVQLVKLYPEGNAETRFKRSMAKAIYYYCNRDGLFVKRI